MQLKKIIIAVVLMTEPSFFPPQRLLLLFGSQWRKVGFEEGKADN